MFQEAKRFIGEEVRIFVSDEETKRDFHKLARFIQIALLGLAISGCEATSVNAGANKIPETAKISLPLILKNYPNDRIPQIYNHYLKYQPDHPIENHVWEWEIHARDGDANLLEFCISTSARPEENCTQRPPNIKQWGGISAKGWIHHSRETNCASIKADVRDEEGNRSQWSDEDCLPAFAP